MTTCTNDFYPSTSWNRSHAIFKQRMCVGISAARGTRSFERKPCPRNSEGAGKTGCALHPRSHVRYAQKMLHMSIQVQRRTPGLPCAMALRLIRVRPGDRLSCHHRRAKHLLRHDLTPAPGRRTQTTSPYARAALVSRCLTSTAPCPSFATMAYAPSWNRMAGVVRVICPTWPAIYFSQRDWTSQIRLKSLRKLVCPRNGLCIFWNDRSPQLSPSLPATSAKRLFKGANDETIQHCRPRKDRIASRRSQ